jgi:hypothetical protein
MSKAYDNDSLHNKMNRNYVQNLNKDGPGGIKKMNLGTSFVVAPIYTQKP